MLLQLQRQIFTTESTIGELLVDGKRECFTLEDVVRPGAKIFGETAIPEGTYRVVVTVSPKFGVRLPLLVDVPGYEGVRIHPGNTKRDTLGCVLVGTGKGTDIISGSKVAFAALMAKIEKAALTEEVLIDIVNQGAPVAAAARGGTRGVAPKAVAKKAASGRGAPRRRPQPVPI